MNSASITPLDKETTSAAASCLRQRRILVQVMESGGLNLGVETMDERKFTTERGMVEVGVSGHSGLLPAMDVRK